MAILNSFKIKSKLDMGNGSHLKIDKFYFTFQPLFFYFKLIDP